MDSREATAISCVQKAKLIFFFLILHNSRERKGRNIFRQKQKPILFGVDFRNSGSLGCIIKGPVEQYIDQYLQLIVGYRKGAFRFLVKYFFFLNRVEISTVYELRLEHQRD